MAKLVIDQTPEYVMKKYKIDREYAEQLLELKRKGICECCGGEIPNSKSAHIDHNHKTGKVRGVVCLSCNITFGHIENKPNNVKPENWYDKKGKLHHLDWIVYRGY